MCHFRIKPLTSGYVAHGASRVFCSSFFFIFLVNRSVQSGGRLIKDNRVVSSSVQRVINLSISAEDDVSFDVSYRLVATINHSGPACSSGHYWAYVLCESNNSWLMCNDASVTQAKPSDINNGTSSLFFFIRAD